MTIEPPHQHTIREILPPDAVARHATLLKVWGQGVLICGASGDGKSDLGLSLVDRGHQWVADDLVEFAIVDGRLYGRCPQGFSGFVDIRGLGIINITELYGEQAVVDGCALDLVVTLGQGGERLDGVYGEWRLLGIGVPELLIPYSGRRNMPLLIETAVRANRLRLQGGDPAADFERAAAHRMRQEKA